MKDKFLCVIAGYDQHTEKYLSSIQNKLYEQSFVGTHTKNIPQHITLGTFPVESEQEVVNLVKQVAQKNSPFEITFNHIGIFGGSKVLFIAPDPNNHLLRLKESFGSSFNWTPHTTMLIDEPENIYAAIPIVSNCFSAFQGMVQTLHLYEFWPTKHILSVTLA